MLVIFDCDGVLVDSETLAARVFSECLHKQGISLSPKQCFDTFRGHTLDYCREWLVKNALQVPDNFLDILANETEHAFERELRPVAGVEALINKLLAQNISICVASNGEHKKIKHSLSVCGLLRYFEGKCFSREDVVHGKPAPDLFLYAAESMGVPPHFSIVVEDSWSGMQGARAAGMQVYGYQPLRHSPPVPEGVKVFSRMKALEKYVLTQGKH